MPSEVFDDDYLYFYANVLGEERSDADAEVVARLLSVRPGMRVLDVACGEGRIAGRLARHGCEVVGVDTNERLLGPAREHHPQVTFERGDMRGSTTTPSSTPSSTGTRRSDTSNPATNDAVLVRLARVESATSAPLS